MRVDVLTTRAAGMLLTHDPNIDGIMTFDPPWSVPPPGRRGTPMWSYLTRTASFLRRRPLELRVQYDALVYLSFSPWERRLTVSLSPTRAGFDGPYTRPAFVRSCRLLTHRVSFETSKHLLENCLNLVASILPVSMSGGIPRLHLTASEREEGRRQTGRCEAGAAVWVGLHPGMAGSFKCWPPACFAETAAALCDERDATCLILAAPDQKALAEEVVTGSQHRRVRACITPNAKDLARAVSALDLFVANDGGPAHIASALSIPTACLYGPTDERVFGPLAPSTRIVRSTCEAAPCAYPWGVKSPCCHDRECIRDLPVSRVLAAAFELLDEHRS